MKRTQGDVLYDGIVYTVLTLFGLAVLIPLYFVVIASVSDPLLVTTGQVLLWPRGITMAGYRRILEYTALWRGYANTIFYTASHTLLSLAVTLPAGYALARRDLKGRSLIMKLYTFTMFFSGGLIPTYFLVTGMGLRDTYLVIILLGCVSVYNIILTRTFFQNSLPVELYEAAAIDGCTNLNFFVRVALPLSSAIVAVLVIYTAVGQWNAWFNAMIYLTDKNKYPLQMIIRNIIVNQKELMQVLESGGGESYDKQLYLAESMKYGVIILTSLPVMLLYPLVQKHFVKGVMIGSIKG